MRHRVFLLSTLDPRLLTLLLSFLSFSSLVPSRADEKPTRSVTELLDALKSDNVANRRDAALAICRLDLTAKKETLTGLIDRIANDKDPQTRLAVLDAIFDLGPEAASAVPVLVNAIKNDFGGQFAEEQYGRLRVAWTLGAIGVEAVEPLRPVMAEKKSRTRLAAALVMGRIGPPAVAAIPELITLLGDSDADVRKEAIRSLGRIGIGAEKALIAALALESSSPQVPSPQTRAGIIASLGSSDKPGEEARAAIEAGTRDESPQVRASAIKAAAARWFPSETLVPILIASLAHEDADLRLAAINVVVRDRSLLSQVRPRLGGFLLAENEGVSRHAAYLLQTIGMEAAPELIAAFRDERTRVEQLAEALAAIGARVTASLVTALHDDNPRVRRGAALALGRVRPVVAESVENLAASLSDPAPQVQVAALDSLGQLGPQARQSLDQLRSMLRNESADIRIQTIEALFRIHSHDEQLLNLYIALLNDGESRVQQRAIETIRRLGLLARKSLPTVVERLRSPSSEVRLAAGALVGSLGRAAGDAVPALTPLLTDGDSNVRSIAAEALGQIGPAAQPALADLVRLLDDMQVNVRAAATQALGGLELEPELIRPHVAKSLGDGESDVRNAAIAAIQKYRRRGSIFLPDLIRLAGKEPDQRYLRDALRRFERSGPDPKSIPELLELLDGQPDAVRSKAIEFLGLAGSDATDVIPRLEALGQDPNDEIKKRSHTAIERIKSGKRGTGEN